VNNLIKRTTTGIIFVAVLFSGIFWNKYSCFFLFFFISIAALLEYYKIINKKVSPQKLMGGLISGSMLAASFIHANGGSPKYFAISIAFVFLTFIVELYRKKEFPFNNIAHTLLGVIYIAGSFSLLNYIVHWNNQPYSPTILAGIFILIWSNDTFAFIWGMSFGKHKLFKRISPNKTWEGSIGGAISTLGISYVISIYFTQLSSIEWLGIAIIATIFGSLGDLTESILKRSLEIKDSGNILPGHGGILDRFDAFILAIPFIFVYMIFIY